MRAAVSTGPHLRAQEPGDLDERAVAGLVPELVVDLLEAVEVGDEQRERAARALVLRELAGVRGPRVPRRFARPVSGSVLAFARSSRIRASTRSLSSRTTIAAPTTRPLSVIQRLIALPPGSIACSVDARRRPGSATTCSASARRRRWKAAHSTIQRKYISSPPAGPPWRSPLKYRLKDTSTVPVSATNG